MHNKPGRTVKTMKTTAKGKPTTIMMARTTTEIKTTKTIKTTKAIRETRMTRYLRVIKAKAKTSDSDS